MSFRSHRIRMRWPIVAIFVAVVGLSGRSLAVDSEWTYDFATGSLPADWNHNSNHPAGFFVPAGSNLAAMGIGGISVHQSSAIHQSSYNMSVGDSVEMKLAWAPFETTDQIPAGNNQVFQLGLLDLNDPWATTSDRLGSGDGFWVAGREIEATASTGVGDWGTQTLNLWLHTDDRPDVSGPNIGVYLGQVTIDSYMVAADTSVSTTFLDIDLRLERTAAGDFDYEFDLVSYEWTLLGASTTWVNEGNVFSRTGTMGHDLLGSDDLSTLR